MRVEMISITDLLNFAADKPVKDINAQLSKNTIVTRIRRKPSSSATNVKYAINAVNDRNVACTIKMYIRQNLLHVITLSVISW